MKHTRQNLKLGIALGSGAARGWSHIGILDALAERGLTPSVVAGASVGALVGAAYAGDQLDELRDWVSTLRRLDIFRLMDARLRAGGLMSGNRLMEKIADQFGQRNIEDLKLQFGAVATDLGSGREIWLREGPVMDAIRASSGLPGLFAPVRHNGKWVIDGGLVNPVPVSLCRALGADLVIAVNLNARLVTRRRIGTQNESETADDGDASQLEKIADRIGDWLRPARRDSPDMPGILDVVGTSVNIMQDRITRSRMVGEPPEVILTPHLEDFQLMDFHRGRDAMTAGRQSVAAASVALDALSERLQL
ncbi:MAG: patatin-like phospholipase RssA [Gammaproteobacteria bacterium]